MANFLKKPYDEHSFNRFFHGSDRHLPDPVCAGDPQPQPPKSRSFQCNFESHGYVDGSTARGIVSLGYDAKVSIKGPRFDLWFIPQEVFRRVSDKRKPRSVSGRFYYNRCLKNVAVSQKRRSFNFYEAQDWQDQLCSCILLRHHSPHHITSVFCMICD